MISLLLLVSGFASGFALQPNPALVRSAAMRHAISSPARTALRTDMLAAKDDEGCDVDAPKPPTLAGEKVAVTAIACAVAAGVWYAGLGNVFAKIGSSPILKKAAKRAIGGGLSGAIAGVVQVLTLMWMRTTMNYQYRYGSSTKEAMKKLYEEGGIARFYQGVTFAIFQTPLSRFGDTAANSGVLALLAASDLPIGVRTACASAAASLWRIGLTPLDTMKTTLQVKGKDGYQQVVDKDGAHRRDLQQNHHTELHQVDEHTGQGTAFRHSDSPPLSTGETSRLIMVTEMATTAALTPKTR